MKFSLLFASLLFCQLVFAQPAAKTYTLSARLLKAEKLPPLCGVFAWALTQKFSIEKSDNPGMNNGLTVLLNQPCPESAGDNFFVAGQLYEMQVQSENTAPISYTIINNYSKEQLPTLWIVDIRKLPNQNP
ncbi:MAG: hypothetical protein NTW29_22990 [Bacteroidetes bacterium]|nr:hypothetical protein [Bacteroidota bacterium]